MLLWSAGMSNANFGGIDMMHYIGLFKLSPSSSRLQHCGTIGC